MKLCCDYNAMNRSTYIIAEACSNHMGDLDRAKVLIRGAAEAQANAIKFQAIKREKLHIDPKSLDPRIEIPDFWWAELKKEAIDYGIDLIVTPLYLEAVDLLANRGIFEMKIASGDLIWDDLLERVKEKARIVYLSTGMSNLSEIEKALSCLGWRDHKKEINSHHFPLFIFLFHCVGAYPVPFRDMNLRAIQTMKKAFKLPVGLSDHSLGWVSCLGAISLGARLIEKHITVVQKWLETFIILKTLCLVMGLRNANHLKKTLLFKVDGDGGLYLGELIFSFAQPIDEENEENQDV